MARGSFNFSSTTDYGAGDYVFNFTNQLADANYSIVAQGSGDVGGRHTSPYLWWHRQIFSRSQFALGFYDPHDSVNKRDQVYCCIAVFR
jgi:hypothetical protein